MSLSKISSSSIILMLISPFFGLFYSIKNLSWEKKKWSLIVFVTIFGSIIQFNEGADAYRVLIQVEGYHDMSFGHFIYILRNIISLNPLPGYPTDIYIHVLSYIISSVLQIPALFFPIVAFIYGYFYINALSKILKWEKGIQLSFIVFAIVVLFIIHRTVTSMQTVRTWTGMWVLFNGILGYYQTLKKKYLLLLLIAPLIHFAYFIIAIPAFFVVFVRNFSPKIFIIIYFLSFIININPGGVVDRIKQNELGEAKVNSYYNEDVDPILERKSNQQDVWYARYGKTDAVYLGGNAFAFTLILGGFFKKRMTRTEAGLFATGLMMAALANLGDFIYAFYSRTMANAVLYILAATTLLAVRGELLARKGTKLILIRSMVWISTIIFIPKIVYTLANFIQFSSIYMLAMPIIGWVSEDLNYSIREVIEWFL